jgi:uncharacterized protein (DUF2249 family)
MENNVIISPKTKLIQVLESYPELEKVLVSYAPAFKKLENPLLRNTVAKIATLQQIAAVGNVKVEELINALRKAAGQEEISITEGSSFITDKPSWFNPSFVKREIDIRSMLNAGEQPVNQVITELNSLKPGEIFKVISPFIPAPLIEKASSLNIDHWLKKEEDELFFVYFRKK